MKLSFLAREDALVREAGVVPRVGQAARYYGRSFDAATRSYPATKEPFVCDDGSEDALKCARQVRKGAMFAADEATAAAIGVPFVKTEWRDGVHVIATVRVPAAKDAV